MIGKDIIGAFVPAKNPLAGGVWFLFILVLLGVYNWIQPSVDATAFCKNSGYDTGYYVPTAFPNPTGKCSREVEYCGSATTDCSLETKSVYISEYSWKKYHKEFD